MKFVLSQKLAKPLKVIVLIALVVTFGFFIEEVWAKFTEKSTNFMQFFKRVEFYESPTITFCFKPTIKQSMKTHYNLSAMDWENLLGSGGSAKSMTKVIQDSYYQYGRDFTLRVLNYDVTPVELKEGTETLFENPQGQIHKIILQGLLSYIYGSCYSAAFLSKQYPDQFINLGLLFNDSLKLTDRPEKIEVTITSKTNAYGIIRGTWVEGEQFEASLNVKEAGSVIANLKEHRYHLLSDPPHCEDISHYECLGHGLVKMLADEKFCMLTPYGEMCSKNCPKLCYPLVAKNLIELTQLNVTNPLCETGVENYCMGIMMIMNLVEISKTCSTGCTITEYKGAESGLNRILFSGYFKFT